MSRSVWARLGLRMLRRDLASGEVRVLLAALVLSVCAVSSVSFVTDRAGRALAIEANRLLGGDALLRADAPIADAPRQKARELGLQVAETVAFPSMLAVGEGLKLSELKAISAGFPLRGRFLLQSEDGTEFAADQPPTAGTIWMGAAGARTLEASIGDVVTVGNASMVLAALVVQEPDSAIDYFNVAPRAFLNLSDLPATGLVQAGSRITYRLVVAGDATAVGTWTRSVQQGLQRGQRLETMADARPEIRGALDRADRFLGLAALIAVVLSGIAIAMAARRHAEHHLDACAVMRCLGADQRTIVQIYASELAWLGALGSAIGLLLAWLAQYGLGSWLQAELGIDIPAAGVEPVLQGLGVGFSVLLAFALPPVLALRKVSAARVLRRDLGGAEAGAIASLLIGLSGLSLLLWWKAGSFYLGTLVLLGVLGTLLALALLALGFVALIRALRGRLRGPWRYGLANVSRRARSSIVQVSALGLGVMAVLLLTLVRTDLISRWQDALPADAPNRFMINVQPDQLDAVQQRLLQAGIDQPVLHPMVRARWTGINGQPMATTDIREQGQRARRLAEREFNLSWSDRLRGDDNLIVKGEFWDAGHSGPAELSVEEGLAQTLGWSVGDEIEFDIAGTPVAGTITSLRRVDWGSFKPNFFVLVSPNALESMPASHMGAFHVPESSAAAVDRIVRDFPNLSVIDVEAILAQVRSTADRVASAVEVVFIFTLIAGLLVLVAAVKATQDERLLESGVMRVLGASALQLRLAHLAEFGALGLIAGLTGAVAAAIISGAIAQQIFDLPWAPDWRLAGVGAVLGVVSVTVTGLLATRQVAKVAPAVTLRRL